LDDGFRKEAFSLVDCRKNYPYQRMLGIF